MKNKILTNRSKQYSKKYKELLNAIKQYKKIAIFRHNHPDYDALGSQLGLEAFIKENFLDKEVISVGDDHVTLTGKCFRKMDEVNDEWFEDEFLAIICDTSQSERIADERWQKAKFIVKIDHHPEVEHYGNLEIVDSSMSAAGELIANIVLLLGNYKINKSCAENLYKAMVGDNGRFLYDQTNAHTFEVAKLLFEKGLDINEVYRQMYEQELSDLKVTAFVLSNYKITKHGVAYYILTDKDLKELNLPPIRGKENVNVFAHFKGIHAWLSITEDVAKGEWRVSVRSAKKNIEPSVSKFNGGGHSQACGAKLASMAEVNKLIEELDKLFE